MKAPIRERAIRLSFAGRLPIPAYDELAQHLETALAAKCAVANLQVSHRAQPVILQMPQGCENGDMPDWSKMRIGVERCRRIAVREHEYVQLFRDSIMFNLTEGSDGVAGGFGRLVSFYREIMDAVAAPLDLRHRVNGASVHYFNHFDDEDLMPFRTEDRIGLCLSQILNIMPIGALPESIKACPPTFQTTNFQVNGELPMHLTVDTRIPTCTAGKFAVDFNLTGQVARIMLTRENEWGVKNELAHLHEYIYSLFCSLLTEKARREIDYVKCEGKA